MEPAVDTKFWMLAFLLIGTENHVTNGQGKTTAINILMKNYCFSKCVFCSPGLCFGYLLSFFQAETYHLFFRFSCKFKLRLAHIVLHRRPANTRATLQSRYILCTIRFYVSHLYVLNFALYRTISITRT